MGFVSLGDVCAPHMAVCPIHLYACIDLYAPCMSKQPPDICMSQYPSVHLYIFLCSPYVMGTLRASVHPTCLWIFRGHQYICQEFWCLSVHPFAHQLITVMPGAPHHCGLLLYWTGCLLMSAMLHSVVPFFVVFIMSKASTTMATAMTPPVTVVSSGPSSLLTMAPSLMGSPATSGQHDVVLPPPLTLTLWKCCWPAATSMSCLFRLMPIMSWVLHR